MAVAAAVVAVVSAVAGAVGSIVTGAMSVADAERNKTSALSENDIAAAAAQAEVNKQILQDQQQLTFLGQKRTATQSAYKTNSGVLGSQKNSTIGQMNATVALNGLQNTGSIASVTADQTNEFDQKLKSMADAYNLDILGIDTQVTQTTADIADQEKQRQLIEDARQRQAGAINANASSSEISSVIGMFSGQASAAKDLASIDYSKLGGK